MQIEDYLSKSERKNAGSGGNYRNKTDLSYSCIFKTKLLRILGFLKNRLLTINELQSRKSRFFTLQSGLSGKYKNKNISPKCSLNKVPEPGGGDTSSSGRRKN